MTRSVVALGLAYMALLCLSLVVVAGDVAPAFHIAFDRAFVIPASLSVAAMALATCFLWAARFSFGYLISFYMLSVVAGYIWLSYFTPLQYDHQAARWSAVVSFVAFALPAVFITKPPVANWPTLSSKQMDAIAVSLLVICTLFLGYGAQLGFSVAGIIDSEALRAKLSYPTWLNYATSISVAALLPFCFAWFVERKQYFGVAVAVIVAVLFYPVTLNKTTLIAPFWLLSLMLMLAFFKARTVVILSLLCPVVIGLVAKLVDPTLSHAVVFRVINLRMLATPSSGLDHYYHFFATHSATNFCQITLIGKLFSCSLPEPLSVMMAKEYSIGNFNASLLATEGIASVGIYLAPVAAFLCGALIALGNLVSAGLSDRFVLLSSSILALALMNAPLTISMLTNGGILIFLLWLLAPRDARVTET